MSVIFLNAMTAITHFVCHRHSNDTFVAIYEFDKELPKGLEAPKNSPLIASTRQRQRMFVRLLLQALIAQEPSLQDYRLMDDKFPYQLKKPNSPKFFVSFSHSNNKVALVVSKRTCAIDIELNPVSERVAERYFHSQEKNHLLTLDEDTAQLVRNRLWQLKECFVKLKNSQHLTLELKRNHARIAPLLQTAPSTKLTAIHPDHHQIVAKDEWLIVLGEPDFLQDSQTVL